MDEDEYAEIIEKNAEFEIDKAPVNKAPVVNYQKLALDRKNVPIIVL